jgi:hypothetical protein
MSKVPIAPPDRRAFTVAAPMEARSAERLPEGEGWWFEPKWDGFRCLAIRDGDQVALQAKSGKPLGRYFPEIVALLRSLRPDRFIIDGELLVQAEGRFSFEALQMRLHPSETRIRRLAAETPAARIFAPRRWPSATRPWPPSAAPWRTRRRSRSRRARRTARSPRPGWMRAGWKAWSPSAGTGPTSRASGP